jgi:outer membrane protein
MTTKLLAFALAFSTLAPTVALADKIAFVDMQRALEETEDGKKAKAKLKADFDRKQKELDDKQEELKKMKEDFDKKSALLKPDAQQAEQKKLQDRFVELQQIYARLQQDLAKKEQDATAGIFRKLGVIVQQVAEKNGFDLVVEKSAVMFGKPALDITNEAIRLYNTQAVSEGKKK